jgi:hypothetical protein
VSRSSAPGTAGPHPEPRGVAVECPYLQRARETSWYPIEGYCLASSEGGLRVVTIAEFRAFCTTAAHAECEVYRRKRERSVPERD